MLVAALDDEVWGELLTTYETLFPEDGVDDFNDLVEWLRDREDVMRSTTRRRGAANAVRSAKQAEAVDMFAGQFKSLQGRMDKLELGRDKAPQGKSGGNAKSAHVKSFYCWSCGGAPTVRHNSDTCWPRNQKAGHDKTATRENPGKGNREGLA